jgi:predicted amidohydrolase
LTNWVPNTPGFLDLCDQWETYLKKFQDLAKECKTCIVPGTILERYQEKKSEEGKLLNVAYFIDDKGEILDKYVKKNLW